MILLLELEMKITTNLKKVKEKRNNVSKTCLRVFKTKETKFKEKKHVKMKKTDYI